MSDTAGKETPGPVDRLRTAANNLRISANSSNKLADDFDKLGDAIAQLSEEHQNTLTKFIAQR